MAVMDFYHDVFPRIRRKNPQARFKIVGSDPPDAIRRLQDDPGVVVTGYVPDIRPHLASAGVIVCPLRIGVGIQNKMLEAMSMGKPVVATPIACKGIPGAVPGTHLIQSDDPVEMALSIIELLERPEHRARLGENARELVTRTYSWKASASALEDAYERTLGLCDRSTRYAA
jgi:glycosyltransferase involved in cell wall biosynthesis